MRYFDGWHYRAREGTILYGWACFRLAFRSWRLLVLRSDLLSPRDVELCRLGFFESLDPSSISDDFIRNNHLRLQ